jgi:hypothetical protein
MIILSRIFLIMVLHLFDYNFYTFLNEKKKRYFPNPHSVNTKL